MFTAETVPAIEASESIELTSQWGAIWGSLTSGVSNLDMILNLVAGIIVVVTLVRMIMRKAGGGPIKPLLWWLVIAGALAAPSLIIPLALGVLQLLMNLGLGALQSVSDLAGI